MTMPQDILGVDIAKGWIDVFHHSSSRHERIATTKPMPARFAMTGRMDADILARMGRALELCPTPPGPPATPGSGERSRR